jgi:DNA-binding response OmpR family regulator
MAWVSHEWGAQIRGGRRPLVDDNGRRSELSGANILVVEDETLITMLLEDILDELGCRVSGSAATLKQALDLAGSADAHAAILDVNLGGDPVFPVAEQLVARNIPIVFASGYGVSGLPDKWQSFPTLPKPFLPDQVETVLRQLLTA